MPTYAKLLSRLRPRTSPYVCIWTVSLTTVQYLHLHPQIHDGRHHMNGSEATPPSLCTYEHEHAATRTKNTNHTIHLVQPIRTTHATRVIQPIRFTQRIQFIQIMQFIQCTRLTQFLTYLAVVVSGESHSLRTCSALTHSTGHHVFVYVLQVLRVSS